MAEPLISAEDVDGVFEDCLWANDCDGEPVHVKGIGMATFCSDRLARHRDQIVAMLDGLPDSFKASGGGGMSFLNACEDANGVQWTGLHRTMERLFLLGIGIGRVVSLMPRELWPALPGGMPYYRVEASDAV